MTSLLRCRVCGFIIKEGKLGDRCPACGVPRTAFESYDDKITEKRRKLLDMDIHPVVVHFPQAFSVFILFLTIFTLIFPNFLRAEILCSIPILAIFLPLVTAAAIFSGAFDGKTRFKKLNRH